MIEGVVTKSLKVVPDERGWLMEMLRCDDELFTKFGQAYVSAVYPGVVKGWHSHSEQTDIVICVSGMVKLVLYDNRDGSPSRGQVQEFFIGEKNPLLVQIPPKVIHGWKGISPDAALVVNIPDIPYNYDSPDEIRIDPHDNEIPYDWARKDG